MNPGEINWNDLTAAVVLLVISFVIGWRTLRDAFRRHVMNWLYLRRSSPDPISLEEMCLEPEPDSSTEITAPDHEVEQKLTKTDPVMDEFATSQLETAPLLLRQDDLASYASFRSGAPQEPLEMEDPRLKEHHTGSPNGHQ